MTISLFDGFDAYGFDGDPATALAWTHTAFNGKAEPYGFTFRDEAGSIFAVNVERTDQGQWRLTVKGEGELLFNEPPRFFMAMPS